MKHYDVIIIGGGGGTKLRPVNEMGKRVAIIEKEDLGGTCLNRGCIPSKMLIHAADVADEVRGAGKYNLQVDSNVQVDFTALVDRVTNFVEQESASIGEFYQKTENVDYYHAKARFVENKVIELAGGEHDGEQLTADYVFIATGTRPAIPEIEGLAETPFMTSREALRNNQQPKSMIVIGGGYIAVELGHFYGALGTNVTFLVRSKLLRQMDSESATEFARVFSEKYNVRESCRPQKVTYTDGQFLVEAENSDGTKISLAAETLFVATGIRPNSDDLGLENTAIETDENGYIKVDDYLQTAVEGVYALGDVVGNYFFRHSVNFEGEYLLDNLFVADQQKPIDYPPMPYAVFSSPQVAGVGMTEDQLIAEGIDYVKGLNYYKNSAMGDALRADSGFVKLLFAKKDRQLLGAHIVGVEASDMIHMLVAFMNMKATLDDVLRTIYVHPALPENIRNAARKAKLEFKN